MAGLSVWAGERHSATARRMPPRRRPRRLPGGKDDDDDDDDEWRPSDDASNGDDDDDDDEEEEEEEEEGDSEAEQAGPSQPPQHSKRKITISDDDDEDDDEEVVNEPPSAPTARVRSHHGSSSRSRTKRLDDQEEDSDDEQEDSGALLEDREDERYVINDPDATDEITGESLAAKHVAWKSPDGSLVMRFNLSTLRKIAARAGEWRSPPHFRSKMDDKLKAQIMRKFGKRALYAVWNGTASGVGMAASSDSTFFERLAEFDARRLSDVHNLYVCPICLLWLRTAKPEDADAPQLAASGASSSRRPADVVDVDDDEDDEEEEEDDDDEEDLAACEPIGTLFGAPMICAWHRRQSLPPEVAAAQCCFRKQSELNQHLKQAHCLTDSLMRGTRERLGAYVIRGGDGLVHRWLNSSFTTPAGAVGRRAASEGHVRNYWQNTAERIASNEDDNEAWWYSRAALFRALYDEVETQGRGDSYGAEADDALFGDRLAATQHPVRPCGAASRSDARDAAKDAWARLGFGGGDDDDLSHFVARDDEEEEEEEEEEGGEESEDGGRGRDGRHGEVASHQAMHMQMQLNSESESVYESSFVDEEEGGEESGDEGGGQAVADEDLSEDLQEEGESDDSDLVTRRIEYADEPDALELAERRLRRKKRAAKAAQRTSTASASTSERTDVRDRGGSRRGLRSGDGVAPASTAGPSARKKRVIDVDEDEEHEEDGEDEEPPTRRRSSGGGSSGSVRRVARRVADDDSDDD